MSAEQRLVEDRANRKAARALVEGGVTQVKADLAARGIGGRIADSATGRVRAAAGEAIEVASESKGIIAGTIGALALWFWRRPLLDASRRLYSRLRHRGEDRPPETDRTADHTEDREE